MTNREDFGDFADFGSHFLDTMLEVEVTEEDGEVNISQSDDPSSSNERELPPIPRFDLQLESLSYKNVCRNSITELNPSAVLRTMPPQLASPTVAVPVIQPSPMILIRSNANVSVKPNGNAVLHGNPKVTSMVKGLLANSGTNSANDPAHEFIKKVFKSEYIKKVFTKKDTLGDVSQFSEIENAFYNSVFIDLSKVQLCKLHCTICDKHLGCGKGVEKKINVHSMLKVLTCRACSQFYGDGNFPCDDGDHCEIYCRWCGQGGALICCSFCPKVFCKRCVRRNFSGTYLKAIEKASDWACFICAQKPLWPHRAVCRALMKFLKQKNISARLPFKDSSICCKPAVVNKKIITEMERNKIFMSGGQTFQLNANGKTSGGVEVKKEVVVPPKAVYGNGHVKNFGTPFKINNQNKVPLTVFNKHSVISVTPKNVCTNVTKNILPKPAVNTVPPLAPIAGLPNRISAALCRGSTTITPTSAKNSAVVKKELNKDQASSSSGVKVSVADCVNVDVNNIPIARIPPYAEEVILRLSFPDKKVQLVRLLFDESASNGIKNFPIPVFENSENLDFLESSLEDSFKLTKMLFERLMMVKNKLSETTKFTKDSVYRSSIKKLSFIYEKSRELLKELDDDLLSNYEIWKNDQSREEERNIMELSDDEGNSGKHGQKKSIFERKSKLFSQDEDSDIEIIETIKNHHPPRVNLRSGLKRNIDSRLRLGRVRRSAPAVLDVPQTVKKKRPVGRPKKKAVGRPRKNILVNSINVVEKCNEDIVKVPEKDPLAMSDPEPEVSGQVVSDLDLSEFLTSSIEIKEEKNDIS